MVKKKNKNSHSCYLFLVETLQCSLLNKNKVIRGLHLYHELVSPYSSPCIDNIDKFRMTNLMGNNVTITEFTPIGIIRDVFNIDEYPTPIFYSSNSVYKILKKIKQIARQYKISNNNLADVLLNNAVYGSGLYSLDYIMQRIRERDFYIHNCLTNLAFFTEYI